MKKVILILVDGMRPDGMEQSGNSYFEDMKMKGAYSLKAQTTFPSITLPCHFSLFYGVPTERHGITTNFYIPLARPLPGIYEQLRTAKRKNGIFYNWAELRDLARPGTYEVSYFAEMKDNTSDDLVCDAAIKEIKERDLDFAFVYFGLTDIMGHTYGWMGEEYLKCIDNALSLIKRIEEAFPDYTIFVTADHGGHGRSHGENIPDDMTIPMFVMGKDIKKGYEMDSPSIMDIAPTVAEMLEADKSTEWEGKSLLKDIIL